MRIMLRDEHQPRRYLAKSVHAVNGGSATEVDGYQNPEHDIRDNKISNAGKAPTQNSRGALASSWLSMEGTQDRIRSSKMTQTNLLRLKWMDIEKIPRCPIPGISLSVQTKFRETRQVRFWSSGMSGPQKGHGNVVMV